MDDVQIKFEQSPAESLVDSFVSTPGSQYPPLFSPSETMNPSEIMTPPFNDDDSMFDQSMMGSMAGTPAPEKKPVKKRKSWGQQLPEPKTNLPPRYANKLSSQPVLTLTRTRKRAKTEDEKEQRRVERVLRNRRAAQSSRERKRQEVEALEGEKRAIERKNHDLELRLADAEAKNLLLQQQIAQITGNMTVFNQSPSSSQYRQSPTPITFSQELFGSREGNNSTTFEPVSEAHLNLQESIRTVNPASLSPEIRPVAELSNASSSDMTQHPAAMLCDLQCQSEEQRPWMTSTETSTSISTIIACLLLISATTSTFLQPLYQIISSLKTGSSLSPTTSILNMIIWLATTPTSLTISTSTTSSSTTMRARNPAFRPRFSLRMNLLRRLLACSPQLARPLMDATMGAMRLSSEQQLLARDCLSGGVDACDRSRGQEPLMEGLMTLLWATNVIDRELKRQDQALRLEEVDPATELRQACRELDELFKIRSMRRTDRVSLVEHDKVGSGWGTQNRWSLAFKHL
jgi:transcriptional activator HAC1